MLWAEHCACSPQLGYRHRRPRASQGILRTLLLGRESHSELLLNGRVRLRDQLFLAAQNVPPLRVGTVSNGELVGSGARGARAFYGGGCLQIGGVAPGRRCGGEDAACLDCTPKMGMGVQVLNMRCALVYALKVGDAGASRLQSLDFRRNELSSARRRNVDGFLDRSRQRMLLATAVAVESPAAASLSVSDVEGNPLLPDDSAPSTKSKPKRSVKAVRRKGSTKISIPDSPDSLASEIAHDGKGVSVTVPVKPRAARVSRKKVSAVSFQTSSVLEGGGVPAVRGSDASSPLTPIEGPSAGDAAQDSFVLSQPATDLADNSPKTVVSGAGQLQLTEVSKVQQAQRLIRVSRKRRVSVSSSAASALEEGGVSAVTDFDPSSALTQVQGHFAGDGVSSAQDPVVAPPEVSVDPEACLLGEGQPQVDGVLKMQRSPRVARISRKKAAAGSLPTASVLEEAGVAAGVHTNDSSALTRIDVPSTVNDTSSAQHGLVLPDRPADTAGKTGVSEGGHLQLEEVRNVQQLLGLSTTTSDFSEAEAQSDIEARSDAFPEALFSSRLNRLDSGTEYQGGRYEWNRSAEAAGPRRLPMIVSKWRNEARPISPPWKSENVLEIIRCLHVAKTSEEVGHLMNAFADKITSQEVKQVMADLGLQRDWVTALRVLEWLQDQPNYKPDENLYQMVINVLTKARRIDKVELVLTYMKKDGLHPGLPEYSPLVLGYLRSGSLHRAVLALDRMRQVGLKPLVSLYNAMIDGCSRIPKGWETALSLFDTMKQDGVEPDRATYTSLVLLACRKGRFTNTVELFRAMVSRGYTPDKATYHAALNSYAKLGDTKRMLEVFEQLNEQTLEHDVVFYNVVLNALGRAGETGKVAEYYKRMRKAGVAADLQTCSILITAFGRVREWEQLDLVLEEMQNSVVQPDLTVYNSLISVYGKAGRLDAVEQIVADIMSASDGKSRLPLDLVTYNTLVDIYGKAGRLQDVKFWFGRMKQEGFPPDVKTFNALLNAYGRAGLFDGVKEVLRLFREHGSRPDLAFYNTLLFTFGRAGKYEDSWQILADMEQAGYYPSVEVYNSLIFVFGRGSQFQAMKVYDHMISSGVAPNVTSFKLLIDIHGKRGMVDDCLKLYTESLRNLGKQVNDGLLSSVFGACCNMRRIEDAEKLLTNLHGKQPVSLACHNWVILGYGRKGLWQKSEQILQETMARKKVEPNVQTFSFLLEAYSLCGQFEKGAALAEKMRKENMLGGIGGFNSVLRFYVRSGRYKEALDLHDDLVVGKGPHPNHTSYAVLIEAFGPDEAVNRRLIAILQSVTAVLAPKVVVFTALLAALTRSSRSEDIVGLFGCLKYLGLPPVLAELMLLDEVGEQDAMWQGVAEFLQGLDREGLNAGMQRGFHNALVDALWVLGWEIRALRVVERSLELGIFGDVCTWSDNEWVLRLSCTSVGAAQVLLLTWIAQIQTGVEKGLKVPPTIRIILCEEWQVLTQDNLNARQVVVAQLKDLEAPFSNLAPDNLELVTSGTEFLDWLSKGQSTKSLFLSNSAAYDQQMRVLRKQALQLFREP